VFLQQLIGAMWMEVNKNLTIGIAIGVFLAGIGIGYGIFMNSNSATINSELIDQMMQNPQLSSQMMSAMFKDPKFMEQLVQNMKTNHDFSQNVITSMINDPNLRLQMMGHMTENQETMTQMRTLMAQDIMSGGKGMMENSMNDSTNSMKMMTEGKDTVDFSDIRVTNITPTSVTIIHTTDRAVNCQVEYGLVGSFTDFATDSMNKMDMPHKEHEITITGLVPNTTYNYKLKATLDGNAFYSQTETFTTTT